MMARLRNRICKADYWGDGDLLRMPRDMRETYRGLWAVAEDSGCLEDDPFTWKLLLWPSPMDADITVALITEWRDRLLEQGKLISYQVAGKQYFFIEPFHRHEHPRNPQINDLPLPPWVQWTPSETDRRKGTYKVDWDLLEAITHPGQDLNDDSTTVVQGLTPARPALPCPALPCPVLPGTTDKSADADLCSAHQPLADDDGIEWEEPTQPPKRRSPTPYQKIVDLFNECCPSLPSVQSIANDSRRKRLKAAHDALGMDGLETFFRRVEASDFLAGRTKEQARFGIDWITKPGNFVKILEGNYDNRGTSVPAMNTNTQRALEIFRELKEGEDAGK